MRATIDRQICTGDKCRIVRTEKGDQPSHFFGPTKPADRNLRQNLGFENLCRNGSDHGGCQIAGLYGIDRHAFFSNFQRQRLGKAMHAGLGRRIIGLSESAF